MKASPTHQSVVGINSTSSTSAVVDNPLDQLSSADIAVHVARLTGLPESTAVVNHADTVNIQLTVATANDAVVAKPQVVSTDLKSRRDIIEYTTQPGDTVSSLAAKFNVTSDTIRWSNNLNGNTIPVGKVLQLLPGVNGVVYKTQPGDTVESLARRFQGNKDQIVAFNDAEGGLPIGQFVIIPGGTPNTARGSYSSTSSVSASSASFSPTYGSNGYDYGWCTWYVAARIAVPTNWGNASTWDNYAAVSGWIVSPVPKVGGIGQKDGGFGGHVGIIEAVSEDGKMVKYSDMNGLAGFARVGYSDWVPASQFDHYIYR